MLLLLVVMVGLLLVSTIFSVSLSFATLSPNMPWYEAVITYYGTSVVVLIIGRTVIAVGAMSIVVFVRWAVVAIRASTCAAFAAATCADGPRVGSLSSVSSTSSGLVRCVIKFERVEIAPQPVNFALCREVQFSGRRLVVGLDVDEQLSFGSYVIGSQFVRSRHQNSCAAFWGEGVKKLVPYLHVRPRSQFELRFGEPFAGMPRRFRRLSWSWSRN